ncbi:MAG: DNA-3-methyladenine glycosylase family protein [Thermomicrobiales bacterium]
MAAVATRRLHVPEPFSLAITCAPVLWSRGRWPSVEWHDGGLIWVGWEADQVVWRGVRQDDDLPSTLIFTGTADPGADAAWASGKLGIDEPMPPFADPILRRLAGDLAGLRPWSAGSLAEGVVTAIVGQSISVAAAAVTEARLAALYHPGIELAGRRFYPFPRLDQLAGSLPATVRPSGVTWRRAEAIVTAAQAALAGQLPDRESARRDSAAARTALRALPLVGPWTTESALLWGIAEPDAHPTGDVALLRAARLAYAIPDLTLKDLDALADSWRPARAWAARLLWANLLGTPAT